MSSPDCTTGLGQHPADKLLGYPPGRGVAGRGGDQVVAGVDQDQAGRRGAINVDDRLQIDFNHRQVIVEGEEVKLRPTEYRLLYHLVNNAGWTLPHETLLAKVWGHEYRDETHYLRLYITYLRQKLEEDPTHPKYILTERGLGYRFVDFKKSQSS